MTVTINNLSEQALELNLIGKIEKSDYEQFTPKAERIIAEHGRISLLVELPHKMSFTPAALWEDLKFDVKHFNDVDRIALVSNTDSREWLATISKPFTRAEVRFFSSEEIDDARSWVKGSEDNA